MVDEAAQHDPIDDWLASKWSLLHIGPRRSLLLYAAGALVGLGLAGFSLFTAKGTSVRTFPPEDVALVNGRHILKSDFVTQTQVEAGVPYAQTTQAERAKVLNEMVDEELLVQRGLEVDLAASDPDVRSAMVAGVNLQVDADVLAQQPTDADLHAFYEAHIAKYSSDGVMDVRDLVMPIGDGTAADAIKRGQQAADEINAGAPIDSVLPKYALKDSGQIDQADNFDFAVKAKLGDEIFAALQKTAPGHVSTPVQRPDGIHIVLLTKRIPSVKLDYAKAADNVWQDYKKEKRENVEGRNLKYLKGRADIELAPEFRADTGK
jgi:parvulin-like peptidyl-prolyl isomerase